MLQMEFDITGHSGAGKWRARALDNGGPAPAAGTHCPLALQEVTRPLKVWAGAWTAARPPARASLLGTCSGSRGVDQQCPLGRLSARWLTDTLRADG